MKKMNCVFNKNEIINDFLFVQYLLSIVRLKHKDI